jgi:hypothetical protein
MAVIPALTHFSQSSSSRSSWLIAIRSILQPYGGQEELPAWLEPELFTWPRQLEIERRQDTPVLV